jgi:hypothetical protein
MGLEKLYFMLYIYILFSDLGDFDVNTFEPRLISSFPMVIPVREPFYVKTFIPDGKPAPSFRYVH